MTETESQGFLEVHGEKLVKYGMKQSDIDPSLFIGYFVMTVMYVEDILMWSHIKAPILDLGIKLYKNWVELEEDDVAVFLVQI